MAYDKQLVAGKLRRWEKYLNRFRLPQWDDIPDFGLYMEQVIVLLKKYAPTAASTASIKHINTSVS